MELKDQLRFRELQIIFFNGMIKYPNDAERAEQGFRILEKFIDDLLEKKMNDLFQRNAIITHRGEKKGGGFKN
jgi:hypothetical protein